MDATSQNAVMWRLNILAAAGSPRTICRARTGVGLPETASARTIPAVISACDPNLVGMAYRVSASSSPNSSAATSASAVQPT